MDIEQIQKFNFIDLVKTLENYKEILDTAPDWTPHPGLYYQFEFWNDSGTMKLCCFIEGDWYQTSLTKIT